MHPNSFLPTSRTLFFAMWCVCYCFEFESQYYIHNWIPNGNYSTLHRPSHFILFSPVSHRPAHIPQHIVMLHIIAATTTHISPPPRHGIDIRSSSRITNRLVSTRWPFRNIFTSVFSVVTLSQWCGSTSTSAGCTTAAARVDRKD
jgi:hypothetical protein